MRQGQLLHLRQLIEEELVLGTVPHAWLRQFFSQLLRTQCGQKRRNMKENTRSGMRSMKRLGHIL